MRWTAPILLLAACADVPYVLVQNQEPWTEQPVQVLMDAKTLYWVDYRFEGIYQVDKASGSASVLTRLESLALNPLSERLDDYIGMDSAAVYIAPRRDCDVAGELWMFDRVTGSGTLLTTFLERSARDFAIDAESIYWVAGPVGCDGENGSISKLGKSGGPVVKISDLAPVRNSIDIVQLVSEGSFLFWIEERRVRRYDKVSGEIVDILQLPGPPEPTQSAVARSLFALDGFVYFATTRGVVWKVRAEDGSAVAIQTAFGQNDFITIDATGIYTRNSQGPERFISRTSLDGTSTEVIIPDYQVVWVSSDDAHVYWALRGFSEGRHYWLARVAHGEEPPPLSPDPDARPPFL